LNIAFQVLDVLRAAHENGIIHRDIKPANLFVLRDGRVKVLDFGISRLRDGAEPFDSSATGGVMGTPLFMAPEQARAVTLEVDPRTDLFGLGATLFTLISGKFLYTGDESEEVMRQAATQQARSLGSVAPGTPQLVIDLVAKAVAYDSAARWESAEAMQEAVRQVHEALCGPFEFETLATLVLVREFRRKSHAKLTAPQRLLPRPSGQVEPDPSPLSTTLPAVADVTRSRESFREARISQPIREALESRLSVGPPELAGWTGHVPAPVVQANGAATQAGARFGRPLNRARLLRGGALLAALFVVFYGVSRYQSERRAAAARAPEVPDIASLSRAQPAVVATTDTLASIVRPTVPLTEPSAPKAVKLRPPPRRVPPAPEPTPPPIAAPAESWKDAVPGLVRPVE
jgi:serine/threonine-protein kinase